MQKNIDIFIYIKNRFIPNDRKTNVNINETDASIYIMH